MIKRLILLLFVSFLLIHCSDCKTDKEQKIDTSKIKEYVDLLLTNWHRAASEANFENYFGAMDSVSIFIGTDASEIWSKKEFEAFSKPYFDKGKAWDFKTLDRNIYTNNSGNFVWFDELLITWMGTCRGSGVLEKTDNKWKIKHYVLSVPIPNDDINTIIAAKKEKDSIFLQKNYKDKLD
ncbi:MAG: nuclear transport factor 2 family protein [Polaribacter sp.]